ncbi:protein SOSEKI 5-like [Mercurialis annua]|uniref:protein SOSEKI 5-like n=1 Tax=Mercurialis annua TaxID=3986 RepID=UPI0021602425|nr:protein SOSEKI 5-like [Mercurialis annua]
MSKNQESKFSCSRSVDFQHPFWRIREMQEQEDLPIRQEETGVVMQMNYQDNGTNNGGNKMQLQPQPETEKKVPVVYYLSRNGQLEHPHFAEVSLSSSQGLYLRDVINTLNNLRGQGLASMYSWASKRSYKNAFLWQDLSTDDFIYPCHDQDYILKGSLLFESSPISQSINSMSSSSNSRRSEMNNSSSDTEDSGPPIARRKNHLFSSIADNIDEHKVDESRTTREFSEKGSDVLTQADSNRRVERETEKTEAEGLHTTKLKKKEASVPTLKSIGLYRQASNRYKQDARVNLSSHMNESGLLMKLIGCGCGSKKFKDFNTMKNRYVILKDASSPNFKCFKIL